MAEVSVERTLEDDNNEDNLTKRMKKEPGGVTKKSVVVLLSSDVMRHEFSVFMPNTIEMAQLKKQGKGQFKTNVEISSKMTELDIERKLVEIFPILKHKRFYCAAAVENRTRLDFHGEPRIWDGPHIKRKIKGNSALYILTGEEQRNDHIVRGLEQSTLKRSHDEVITNEGSDSTFGDMVPVKMAISHTVYSGSGKQAKFFAIPGNPQKNITDYPIVVSGATQTVLEKGDINLHPTEGRQLTRQDVLDKLPQMQGFVLCHPNVSTVHSISTARDVVTMATSSLPQSLPMGTIMVPAGGIVVAKPGPVGDKATCISTASDQQSSEKAVFHVVKGPDTRQPGFPLAPQVIVSSTLTPQMKSLHISSTTSQQSQKPGVGEISIGRKDQDAQTAETTETSQQAPTITTLGLSKRCFPVEYRTATEPQEVVRFKTADHSRQSLDENISSSHTCITEKGACAYNTAIDGQHLTSDHESLLSDPSSDSGIEITDNSGGISQSEMYLDVEMQRQKVANLNEAEWTRSDRDADAGLILLRDVALKEIRSAETKKKSIVDEICPKRSSVMGGIKFFLILNERLPSDVVSAHAYFGNCTPVFLTKINDVNLTGQVPACPVPGKVTVTVNSSTGTYLGETWFEYVDEIQNILRQLVYDKELQGRFFHFWAQELGNKTDENEKWRASQPPSSFKTDATDSPGSIKKLSQHFDDTCAQVLGNEESGSDHLQPAEHSVVGILGNQGNESAYDADDEASSSDSSDDGNVSYNKLASGYSNSKMFFYDVGNEFIVEGEEQLESVWEELCVFYERLNNSPDSAINENLDNLPFHGLESEATVSQLDSSAFPVKREEEVSGLARNDKILEVHEVECDNNYYCGSAQDNSETPGRSNNPVNTDNIDGNLNVDVDQNSVADKTRRAEERSGDEEDSPADPL